MLKQNLSQKLQQKLSPQQIQLMKLVQLQTQSLEARIKQEIEEARCKDEGVKMIYWLGCVGSYTLKFFLAQAPTRATTLLSHTTILYYKMGNWNTTHVSLVP